MLKLSVPQINQVVVVSAVTNLQGHCIWVTWIYGFILRHYCFFRTGMLTKYIIVDSHMKLMLLLDFTEQNRHLLTKETSPLSAK